MSTSVHQGAPTSSPVPMRDALAAIHAASSHVGHAVRDGLAPTRGTCPRCDALRVVIGASLANQRAARVQVPT